MADIDVSGLSDSVLVASVIPKRNEPVSAAEVIKLYTRNYITISGEEITHGIVKGY